MRGRSSSQIWVVCLFNLEDAVPDTHPIRRIKRLADEALGSLEPVFSKMYAETGRPSVPPERLLLASVLMALYSVRSERMFCERLRYDLLFRWFLDMGLDEAPFDGTCFGKNRARLIDHDVAKEFFAAVVELARAEDLVSSEHFSVDGTLDGTLGADRGYDTTDFVGSCRSRGITPHVAQHARECDSA
jgi:transposase